MIAKAVKKAAKDETLDFKLGYIASTFAIDCRRDKQVDNQSLIQVRLTFSPFKESCHRQCTDAHVQFAVWSNHRAFLSFSHPVNL